MRRRRLAGLAAIPLIIGVGGLVAPPPALGAAPAASQASAAGTELYVDQNRCRNTAATGSEEAPVCTISAAAAMVQPGSTVWVGPGNYQETVTITRSGTEQAPITFRALAVKGPARVGFVDALGSTFNLFGVHDVVIADFALENRGTAPVVTVENSERITLDGNGIYSSTASVGLRITGGSRDVRVTRQWFRVDAGAAMAVEDGSTNTLVAGSQGFSRSGLSVSDAPHTVVTGNTWVTRCQRGISVTGTSTGASLRNNIVSTNGFATSIAVCKVPADAVAITVDGSSTEGTVVDYNLLDPSSRAPLYVWDDTVHADRDTFVAAIGQGGHDLVGDPRFDVTAISQRRGWIALLPDSPAIDSADGAAAGATATDILRNPYTDDPAVANSGTGSGYRDRGAWERQGPTQSGRVEFRRVTGGGPSDTVATGAPTWDWPTESNQGAYAFRFGDKPNVVLTESPQANHTFRRAGLSCVEYHRSINGFRDITTGIGYDRTCTVTGAAYTAVTPKRLLDTRAAVGVTSRSALGPFSAVSLPIPEINGVPTADISAVVLNVTVTEPTVPGFLQIYDDPYWKTTTSSVNFVAHETVPNLVTVPVDNGQLWFGNESSGSVHVVADVQGFYSANGSGFRPLSPTRVLDTRSGAGTPMAPNGDLRLDLSDRLPGDATAAILNVTVTQPTTAGVLTLYPDGAALPVASNLNFVAGQTIPNLVTVPVVRGKVALRNSSSGTTHVVADLAGYYGSAASGATQSYVPLGPSRVFDSRTTTGLNPRPAGPVGKQGVVHVRGEYYLATAVSPCTSNCPAPTAVVANLTVTAPTTAGVLTAYPYGEARPTASNVNFVAGETASNLAVVKTGDGLLSLYNNSSGSSHVIVDQAGYFIAAPS
ncbi:NosD domain-containing protein [Micromonospora sp. NPDC049366]|uniref:NosD domain-containing protein n=1 Tax=Micromonospora sp. NPDC049366 TaxID=3364271 RepID=UPI0037B9F8BD